ncbi:alpha/beta hydrolase [Dactylosporangium sp. AC04546]|uniref:alpha/beta fold hydrolase n=1 Tax=Dactylosporangium sp. AC04546 TaxID=2862460 RepID=UPI002E7B9A7E|nr:alpha/beta hydrolase [Dactylosporangium sp. AC04546]WVK78205.1 alpha/beta hydrolase [Dactylosporangium sp. AC04546]
MHVSPTTGVSLYAETHGDPSMPPILLISGATASMDWWEPEFCDRLAAAGRLVIRYDHRDTGESTTYPAGAPGYQGLDLCTDALAVAAACSPSPVHLVGVSMGGGIAQRIAAEHPARVASVTLIASSPIVRTGELPPPDPRITAPPPPPDWTNRDEAVDRLVTDEALYGGDIPQDTAAVRAVATRVFDRSRDLAAGHTNHLLLSDDTPFTGELTQITAPVLVLHGTADPLFPYPHGEALAAAIPGARLVPLQGMGHQVPPRTFWNQVIEELLTISS